MEGKPNTMTEETKALQLATMDALRGAENVKQRLQLEVSTGTPSITDLAYAVKVRIKEDFKIVEKVERKRRGDKPTYEVSSLRDLVGLRIVTLYRLDTLDILPVLLERIISGSREPDSVFSSRGIDEIIIYSTNPTGDAQDLPGRVRALCHAFDLSEITEVETTPQNYTSIHIVVWCRGKYRSGYRDIPVEIQIRTAFEDVWGEIDHSLKYKREGEGEGVTIAKAEAARLELNEAHLNVMKTLIDGLAQYADQIKLQMDGERRIRANGVLRSEQAIDRLALVPGLDPAVRNMAQAAVDLAEVAMVGEGLTEVARRTGRLRAIGDLIRTSEKIRDLNLQGGHSEEVLYVVEMERALLLFEIGNELGGVNGNSYLVEASRIYTAMLEIFPTRVIAKYRLARTLDELGDRHSSMALYQETINDLPSVELSSTHWLHSTAPRLLAFSQWEEATRVLKGAPSPEQRDKALEELFQAIRLSQQALTAAGDDQDQRSKACNNLLYFVLDYKRFAGDLTSLDKISLSPSEVLDLLEELTNDANDDLARLDTIRELHLIEGHLAKAADAARRILSVLVNPDRRERWTPNDAVIQRSAEETLREAAEGEENAINSEAP